MPSRFLLWDLSRQVGGKIQSDTSPREGFWLIRFCMSDNECYEIMSFGLCLKVFYNVIGSSIIPRSEISQIVLIILIISSLEFVIKTWNRIQRPHAVLHDDCCMLLRQCHICGRDRYQAHAFAKSRWYVTSWIWTVSFTPWSDLPHYIEGINSTH